MRSTFPGTSTSRDRGEGTRRMDRTIGGAGSNHSRQSGFRAFSLAIVARWLILSGAIHERLPSLQPLAQLVPTQTMKGYQRKLLIIRRGDARCCGVEHGPGRLAGAAKVCIKPRFASRPV